MSSRWRVRHKRPDGTSCNHLADEPCPHCDADKLKPIAAPSAVSFHLDAAALEQTFFAPWEKPHEITSRAELLQHCEAKGLDSRYLKESMSWPYRKPREI